MVLRVVSWLRVLQLTLGVGGFTWALLLHRDTIVPKLVKKRNKKTGFFYIFSPMPGHTGQVTYIWRAHDASFLKIFCSWSSDPPKGGCGPPKKLAIFGDISPTNEANLSRLLRASDIHSCFLRTKFGGDCCLSSRWKKEFKVEWRTRRQNHST